MTEIYTFLDCILIGIRVGLVLVSAYLTSCLIIAPTLYIMSKFSSKF